MKSVRTDCGITALELSFYPEPEFCQRLRNQGIDSKESIPQAYVAWRAVRQIVSPHRPDRLGRESIPGLLNRFTNTGSACLFSSVADPDPGSAAFLTPGSGIQDG
jgi:hypothetical protein